MARAALRLVYGFVYFQRASSCGAEAVQNMFECIVAMKRVEQRCYGNGAGVDHGIERLVGSTLKFDGIEGVAARLDPDMMKDFFVAEFVDSHAKGKGFGNRLNG